MTLFSKKNPKQIEVFIYSKISRKFKIQVTHILKNLICPTYLPFDVREEIAKAIKVEICKAHGIEEIKIEQGFFEKHSEYIDVVEFFKGLDEEQDLFLALDIIQLFFSYSERVFSEYFYTSDFPYLPMQAIRELNDYFKENGIGYQYFQGEIVKIENEILYENVTEPVLNFLSDINYKNANKEYLSSQNHFKMGRYSECIVDSLKAFESTMKIICHLNKWPYSQNDTAKNLIKICFDNGLIPKYLDNHFTYLRLGLESGAPTMRNKTSSHGSGVADIEVPEYLASYMLYLTGSSIKFLIEANNTSNRGKKDAI